MRRKPQMKTELAALLKQAAPSLGSPDATRVGRVCACLAAQGKQEPPPLHSFLSFARPLICAAASFAVILSIVLAYRMTSKPAPRGATAVNMTIPMPADFGTFVDPSVLTDTLATESENFVSDLTELTAALNHRACAILF